MSFPDHPMKKKAIENAKRAKELKEAGDRLGKQVLVLMLNGGGDKELMDAYDNWRDVSIGKPNWGKTQKKNEEKE